jgi:hypothetical protein
MPHLLAGGPPRALRRPRPLHRPRFWLGAHLRLSVPSDSSNPPREGIDLHLSRMTDPGADSDMAEVPLSCSSGGPNGFLRTLHDF